MMPWHRFGGEFGGGMRGGPFMAIFCLLFFLLLVALVAWAIVVLIRHRRRGMPAAAATGSTPAPSKGEDALELVRLRYARGEITRDEYLALRDDLAK
jgi:uncharacterized membrane protein